MLWYSETKRGMRELHNVWIKDMGDIFSIETRKYAGFYEFCIDAYVKQWKYVPLNPKGPHPIPTRQEMHTNEAVVSLDHDRVSDLVKKGT